MAYDVQVRKALNDKGITNDQITYDNKTGWVQVGGQNFLQPQKSINGSAFSDQAAFNTAWSQYTGAQSQPTSSTGTVNVGTTNVGSSPGTGVTQTGTLGGTGTVNAGTTPTYGTANPMTTQYEQMLQSLISQSQNPTTVDLNSIYASPQYAAYQAQANASAQQSIRAAQEAYGSAGFGRSTGLGERAQGIQNDANLYLNTQVIPLLMQQEQAARQQQLQNQYDALNAIMSQQSRYDTLNQNAEQNALQVGQLTGSYMPPEAEAAIQSLLNLKAQTEQNWMTMTPEQRAAAQAQGDQLRATIKATGVNDTLFGSGVNAGTAQTNVSQAGIQTQAAKEFDQTMAYNQGRDAVADKQWAEQFAYQKARDAIADQQWKQTFDENVRQYGLNYALDKLAQENQQAYQQAQLALAEDDNTRAWAAQTLNEDQFTYQQLRDQAEDLTGDLKSASPTEVNQLLENYQLTGQDSGGKRYKYTPAKGTPARSSWVENTVESLINAGYDDATIDQVLKAAGITDAEQDEVFAGK